MAERMTVIIQGRDDLTVEDAMRQVLDTFELVARADPTAAQSIEWRLVSATKNSPLTVVAEAATTLPGVDASKLAREQKTKFRRCVSELRTGKVPAAWNSPDDRRRARNWMRRTHNGISATHIDMEQTEGVVTVTAQDASIAEPILELPPVQGRPREQVGSVEGYLTSVETYYNKPAIRLRDRRSGADVLCLVPEEFTAEIAGAAGFEDVWRERRVIVRGKVHYDSAGKVERVTATTAHALPRRLVEVSEIKDDDFTAGLPAEEYLEKLRDGDIG
jgi:hypothetical protein